MKKFISLALALLMLVVMLPVSALAAEGYVTVSGIKGFEGQQFASFAEAYAAIKPTMETLGLGEETPVNAEAFDALFTDVTDGKATLTYTISGNVTYDEASCKNLLTMGRKTSHYLTNERHLINFKFVGATGRDSDTLTVNSNITLPYEWWGEKTTTSISFENLTITGSAPNGLRPTQDYFEGINFKVDNCKLEGIKIYHYNNVKGNITFTNNIFDGTGTTDAYAVHLQGSKTEPLTINISNNIISNYARGINIDQKTAAATISNNNISVKDAGRSCIQLTRLASTKVENNTMNLTGGNAITLHEELLKCAKPEITVSGNTINGTGYLIYDDSNGTFTNENLNLTITKDNTVAKTVDTTRGVKDGEVYPLSEIVKTTVENNVVPGGSTGGTIVIITPSEDTTPKTDDQKNPATGANDVVAAAVALMAVSALGMAVLTRKK